VAGSSDGRHLGLTAPRQEGQERAVRRAYADAGLSPTDVGLVEAHGTGTSTGDVVELRTTTTIFDEAGAAPGSVVLGSVKSNIGHTKCASAIASVIKSAKAAYHGVLPPTLHIDRPNEVWDAETSPFVFLDRARPWLDERRLVGVSSFGFGGTNFHAILENHRASAPSPESGPGSRPGSGRPQWPAELVVFRGATADEVSARLAALADRLAEELAPPVQADRWRLRDVAAHVSAEGSGPVRLAIVASDLDDLAALVDAARSGRTGDGVYWADEGVVDADEPPEVAFLAPGISAVRPGMVADVLVAFPELRDHVLSPDGIEPGSVEPMLPAQAFGDDDRARQQAALDQVAAAALTLAQRTLAGALGRFGVVHDHVVTGESDDEVAAAVQALAADGVQIFVEVGPGTALTELVQRTLGDRPHVAVATDRPGERGVTTLLHALARLAVAGVPVDLDALHADRGARPGRWADPPRKPGWIINGHFARTAGGASLPKGLRPASEAPVFHIGGGPAPPEGAIAVPAGAANGNGSGGREGGLSAEETAMVMEYLRIVQGVIATGSQIIQGHAQAQAQAGQN
jgi:acyl transferase domain-containing protein